MVKPNKQTARSIFRELQRQGTNDGFLTLSEIKETLSSSGIDDSEFEPICSDLEKSGIILTDSSDMDDEDEEDSPPSKTSVQRDEERPMPTDPVACYLSKLSEHPVLSPEEEKRISLLACEGDRDAREKLILSNLKLVVNVAHHYRNYGLPFMDLIQEGNMGLIKAVDHFKPQLENRFTTYAIWWIKQSIIRALADQGRTIRLPVYIVDIILRIKRAVNAFMIENNREPTIYELSIITSLPVPKIRDALDVTQQPVSLDMKVDDEKTGHLIDFIPDQSKDSAPDVNIQQNHKQNMMNEILSILTPRERAIITMRLGLDDKGVRKLDVVGRRLNLSSERVRQIESKAILKLREYCETKNIYDLF